MKILVLGGSGRTGKHVIRQALTSGQSVRALVRRPGSLDSSPGLEQVVGDPLDVTDVSRAAVDIDAVISVLAHNPKSSRMVLADSARAVVEALNGRPQIPYLIVSQGLLFHSSNPIVGLLRLFLASTVRDSTAMEDAVLSSVTDYTIVRPPRLKDGATQHGYQVEINRRPQGPASLDRIDLAAFLVDEVRHRHYSRSIIGISRSS